MDKPGPRRVHAWPVPTGGGLAIYLGFWVPVLAVYGWDDGLAGLFFGSAVITLVGLIDDWVELKPGIKLLGQLLAAAVLVGFGTRIQFVTNPLGGMVYLGSWGVPLTLLWIVAVTNMLNIMDGLDGLAAGIASIAGLPLLLIAWQREQVFVAFLTAALIGSTIGFLRYNFNPARVFMGDTGGMLLGFMLGAISVEGALKGATTIALTVPLLVLGVPVFDTVCAVVRRSMNGRPISEADDRHIHHQLLRAGLSQRQAVLVLYTISAVLGVVALGTVRLGAAQALAVMVLLGAAFVAWARRLGVLGDGSATRLSRGPKPPALSR
ncbi:MAG: undecaprenyl/decaprenyl-phosphate alpha-N-acetylglucosaminyl 1-phosphate transferase [Firmicutes bacterium]|nr:undecaprenyl/decaprenyl-phosphate alpha-N-acetylglucosaminyl 1-phosphate transferase [Bacillota bacterium]